MNGSKNGFTRKGDSKKWSCNRKNDGKSKNNYGHKMDVKQKWKRNPKHNTFWNRKKNNSKATSSNEEQSKTLKPTTASEETILSSKSSKGIKILTWPRSENVISTKTEKEMLPTLLHWDNTERGMMKDQPEFRLKQVKNYCQSQSIQLFQALSLRRHHIKLRHPNKSMTALGLGRDDDIKEAAELFESCVEEYLRKFQIQFINEQEQREEFYRHRQKGEKMPPTPDFLFPEPVNLKVLQNGKEAVSNQPSSARKCKDTDTKINWIDAKMFYGASLIQKRGTAAGNVAHTAQKYVQCYGPGAMVFSYGFGKGLEQKLNSMNVTLLDANPLDLTKVERHQRHWCADDVGNILP